jgi:hypothetical protein
MDLDANLRLLRQRNSTLALIDTFCRIEKPFNACRSGTGKRDISHWRALTRNIASICRAWALKLYRDIHYLIVYKQYFRDGTGVAL